MRKATAALMLGAAILIAAPAAVVTAQNWNVEYARTATGHRVGNPEAPLQMVAHVSYSCPGCKSFEMAADAPLRAGFIHEGKLALEVRLAIRNPIDLAASLAAECGPEEKFFDNHRAIMFAQDDWLPVFQNSTQAQRTRWTSGTHGQRMRAIAADGGFYDIMERRGYARTQVDMCLNDEARGDELEAISGQTTETIRAQTTAAHGRVYTPSVILNGTFLEGAHSWPQVERALTNAQQ